MYVNVQSFNNTLLSIEINRAYCHVVVRGLKVKVCLMDEKKYLKLWTGTEGFEVVSDPYEENSFFSDQILLFRSNSLALVSSSLCYKYFQILNTEDIRLTWGIKTNIDLRPKVE